MKGHGGGSNQGSGFGGYGGNGPSYGGQPPPKQGMGTGTKVALGGKYPTSTLHQSNPYVVSLSLAGAGLLGGLAIEEFMDHERNEGYEAGYDNGYDNGFDNGYDDGGGDGGFF